MIDGAPDQTFKVLSIDGGGLRGACPASLLAWIEEHLRIRVADYFDLMVGTSTGGILVLGLSAGLPATDILRFYREDGPVVFPRTRGRLHRLWKAARQYLRVSHDTTALESTLRRTFGDRTIGDLSTRVVIPTFDGSAGEIRLIKTPHHPALVRDSRRTLVEAALATSAAPTYLPGHTTTRGERLIDGGLWANNPVAVAVVEALGYLGIPRTTVRVLSLGTTRAPYHYPMSAMRAGLLAFAGGRARESLFVAQMTGAHAMAKVLLGDEEKILRLDPVVRDGRFEMDRPEDIDELVALGEREAMHNCARLERDYFDTPARFPGLAFN